jgi:hypothetical protein
MPSMSTLGSIFLLWSNFGLSGPGNSMHNMMDDRRSSPRQRVFKNALLITSDKAPKLECAARNLSLHGARVVVSTTYGLPTNFDVVVSGMRRRCRSIWRTNTEMGVAFV